MEKLLKLGPKEIKGSVWDEKGLTKIVQILISHDQDCIKSIQFSFAANGEVYATESHGEPDGLKFSTVDLASPNEIITSVSGEYEDGRLVSVVFGTNKNKYGPFGRKLGGVGNDEFNYEFGSKASLKGFHGSVYEGSLYAFGVYVKPFELLLEDNPGFKLHCQAMNEFFDLRKEIKASKNGEEVSEKMTNDLVNFIMKNNAD